MSSYNYNNMQNLTFPNLPHVYLNLNGSKSDRKFLIVMQNVIRLKSQNDFIKNLLIKEANNN